MSKAITGAALLAGAAGVGAFFTGGLSLAAMAALPGAAGTIFGALAVTGISMEAGAVASALTSNRGMSITTRQAASPRHVIRGTRRTGGVEIYRSTTGSHHDQFNYVIVIAGHACFAITALYLDGRQVFWIPNSVGYSTYNNQNFGGTCDSSTHTGPNGVQYNFGGGVYCEVRNGRQVSGDVIGGLTANDPHWGASANGNPYVGGCTYCYLKVEYNQDNFPSEPEIKFTVDGKDLIYDPRTGTLGFTNNWALHVADHLADTLAGFGDSSINEDQLIAAANICDEQQTCAAGMESLYTLSADYDTTMSPGTVLNKMMECAAGRVRYIGGEHYIFPGAWMGPAFRFDQSALCGGIESEPVLGIEQLCNRVTGTYTAANVPYNIAGNLYDSNGYYNGQIQNNFPFAWQPSSAPQYARDQLHGYASPEDLLADSGSLGPYVAGTTYNEDDVVSITTGTGTSASTSLWRSLVDGNTEAPSVSAANWVNGALILQDDLQLDWVISVSQWQRVAKIHMMRKRFQGQYRMPMFLSAYRMQPLDVLNMTLPDLGWSDKMLEVDYPVLRAVQRGENEPPALQVLIPVSETDPSIYAWSPAEEQNVYSAPALPTNSAGVTQPPTGLALLSGPGVALQQPDGSVVPRIQYTFATPLDAYVTDIQCQYRLTPTGGATPPWISVPDVDVSLNAGYISPVVSGLEYDVQIRSRRANGSVSVWVQQLGFTAGLVLAVQSQDSIGPGSLFSQAFANGTAAITCTPFSALVGNQTLSYFPAGAVPVSTNGTLAGGVAVGGPLAQQTLYYVYFSDPTYAGGNVAPIATTSRADFQGKLGCFLIDSIVTGYANSSGSSNRYPPSNAVDSGTQSTQNPQSAFDGTTSTYATVGANASDAYAPDPSGGGGTDNPTSSNDVCTFEDFPNLTTTTAMTLTVNAAALFRVTGGASAGSGSIVASIGGVNTTLWSGNSNLGVGNLTTPVPVGTNLSTISVTVDAEPGGAAATAHQRFPLSVTTIQVYEIYIS